MMAAGNAWRGHEMVKDDAGAWRYYDSRQLVSDNPRRPCGHCGRPETAEGHDGCLGILPGVANACCGHGAESEAYVQYADGTSLSGREAALRLIELVKERAR